MSAIARKNLRLGSSSAVGTDLYDRIHEVLPIARQLLAQGIDTSYCEFSECIPAEEPHVVDEDDEMMKFSHWTRTTYVLGMAVGLLLNSSFVFDREGGAR